MKTFTPVFYFLLFFTGISGYAHPSDPPADSLRILELDSRLQVEMPYNEGKKIYAEITRICQKNHWWETQLNSGYIYMQWLYDQKRYGEAIEEANELIQEASAHMFRPDQMLGNIYHKKGVNHYFNQEYEEAQHAFQIAIEIRKYLPAEPIDIARSIHNLAVVYKEEENYLPILALLDETIAIQKDLNQEDLLADSYLEYGLLKNHLGDFGSAYEYFNLATGMYEKLLVIAREKKDKEELEVALWDIGMAYNNMGILHHFLKNPEKEEENLKKAISFYEEIDYQFNLGSCLQNLASIYFHSGNYEAGLEYYRKAEAIFRTLDEPLDLAPVYHSIGLLFKAKEDEKEAGARNYDRAIANLEYANRLKRKAFDNADYHPDYSEDHHQLGHIRRAMGDIHGALNYYHLALINQFNDFRDHNYLVYPDLKELDLVGSRTALLKILDSKASLLFELFKETKDDPNLQLALKIYQDCDHLVGEIRTGYESSESVLFLQDEALPIYENAISVAYELHQLSGDQRYVQTAFQFMENSNAILLLTKLKDTQAKVSANIPADTLMKINNFKAVIARREKKIASAKLKRDTLTLTKEETKLPYLKRDYQQFLDTLEKNYPEYHREKHNIKVVDVQKLETYLRETNSALIEYFVGEHQSFIYFLSDQGPHLFQVPVSQDQLTGQVRSLLTSIQEPSAVFNPEMVRLYQNRAHDLYTQLWQPFCHLLAPQQRVIIIQAGDLGYIPFGVLLEKKESSKKFKDYAYLIKKHPLSYAYSATVFMEKVHDPGSDHPTTFLGFAPEFEDHPKLQPLDGTEVRTIRKLIGGKTLFKDEATRDAFFREAPHAGIVHLSTHAFIEDHPFNAWIELADGPVNIAELDTMDLRLEMIVLSACETGTGALERGEGIMSLARIFTHLGCQSIVSSLWKVNNKSTSDIMSSFYRHLARAKTKDLAIQQAQVDYFNSEDVDHANAHPYFWAGFLQSGSREMLPDIGRSWTASILRPGWLFSSLAMLIAYFLWRKRFWFLSLIQ